MSRNPILPAILCASALCLPAAAGGLRLQTGPNSGPDAVDAAVAPGSGEHFFNLTFTEVPPAENEYLYAYELQFETAQPGIRLLRAERPDNFVLTAPDATFMQAEADARHVRATAQDGSGGRRLRRERAESGAGVLHGRPRDRPRPLPDHAKPD